MDTSAKAAAQRLTDPRWAANRVSNPIKAMADFLRKADSQPFASAEYIRYSQLAYDVGAEALKSMDPDSEDFARVSKAVTDIAAYLSIDWGDGGTGDLSQIMTSMVASGDCGCSYSGVTAPEAPEKIDLPENGERYAYWEGPIGFEGQLTGDGRYIEHGALRWSVPQPMRYVSSDVGAHDGAVVVGAIQNIERRDGGVIWGSGIIDLTVKQGPEAYYQVTEGYANGVSMDLDDVSFEVRVAQEVVDEMTAMFEEGAETPDFEVAEDGRVIVADMKPDDEVSVTKDARIRAATIVAIPAFADARITITASGFFAYNPSQARAPKGSEIGGQWIETTTGILAEVGGGGGGSSSGGGRAPASGDSGGLSKIVTIVREEGGASLDPITLEQPTDGYMVAIQGHNVEVPEDDFFTPGVGEDALYEWIEANTETLREPGAHIGLWHDTANKEVVLDVSQRVDTLEDAVALGKERNQQSVWDVVNGVEIPTGGTGDRGADQHAVRGARFSRTPGGVRDVGRGAQAGVRPRDHRRVVGGVLSLGVEGFAYNPNQARAPRGSDIGGQWIPTPSGILAGLGGASTGKSGSLGESITPNPKDMAAMKASLLTGPHIVDGEFTPERKALHDEIVASYLEGVTAPENPTLYMNGGGPGAGKSSMTGGPNAALTGYPQTRQSDDMTGALDFEGAPNPGAVLIDPDSVKAQLPEVKAWRARQQEARAQGVTLPGFEEQWAGASHEESSYLSKRVYRAALDRGLSVVYDGTGDGKPDSVLKKVSAAREAGYRVEANYLYLDPSEGLSRAIKRAESTGRNVPFHALSDIYRELPETFDAVSTGVFDTVRLFDNNNVAKGDPARLIGQSAGIDAPFEVLDAEAYQSFLDSPSVTPVGFDPL